MTLEEIRQLVAASKGSDWHLITLGQGPEGHDERAVYKHDVSLSIEWGREENADFKEDWLDKFHGSRSIWVEILHGSKPVDRYLLVVVDGGRSILPLPQHLTMGIHGFHDALARLCDEIESGTNSQYDHYFERAGLQRLDG